ncbi:hypothetical protein ABEB36_003736, partial [Hypothenemus hampei]
EVISRLDKLLITILLLDFITHCLPPHFIAAKNSTLKQYAIIIKARRFLQQIYFNGV